VRFFSFFQFLPQLCLFYVFCSQGKFKCSTKCVGCLTERFLARLSFGFVAGVRRGDARRGSAQHQAAHRWFTAPRFELSASPSDRGRDDAAVQPWRTRLRGTVTWRMALL